MTAPHSFDVVTLHLGGERLAIATEVLREILEPVPVTRVPTADSFASGLINVRGSVVPLADLRVPFGMPPAKTTADTRFIVLDVTQGDAPMIVAITADKVESVTLLSTTDITPIPEVGTVWPPEYALGMGKMGDDFVLLPDLPRIFHDFSVRGDEPRKDPSHG